MSWLFSRSLPQFVAYKVDSKAQIDVEGSSTMSISYRGVDVYDPNKKKMANVRVSIECPSEFALMAAIPSSREGKHLPHFSGLWKGAFKVQVNGSWLGSGKAYTYCVTHALHRNDQNDKSKLDVFFSNELKEVQARVAAWVPDPTIKMYWLPGKAKIPLNSLAEKLVESDGLIGKFADRYGVDLPAEFHSAPKGQVNCILAALRMAAWTMMLDENKFVNNFIALHRGDMIGYRPGGLEGLNLVPCQSGYAFWKTLETYGKNESEQNPCVPSTNETDQDQSIDEEQRRQLDRVAANLRCRAASTVTSVALSDPETLSSLGLFESEGKGSSDVQVTARLQMHVEGDPGMDALVRLPVYVGRRASPWSIHSMRYRIIVQLPPLGNWFEVARSNEDHEIKALWQQLIIDDWSKVKTLREP